jgi:hypothetical protein
MSQKELYDRSAAVAYAHKWAYSRNPAYYNYDKLGGDCTNFASQCLFEGSRVMNYMPTYGWYYKSANDKSPSWTGVRFLYDFLVRGKGGPGPFAVEARAEDIRPGDIVQISFDGAQFTHTPFVVAAGSPPKPDNILVAAHTYDCDNKVLAAYTYKKLRFLHIAGVNR